MAKIIKNPPTKSVKLKDFKGNQLRDIQKAILYLNHNWLLNYTSKYRKIKHSGPVG